MLTTNKFIAIITFLSAILLSTSYQASSNEPDKAGLSPTDYFKFTFVKDPQVSPNGENILFVKSQAKDDASGRNSHIYIVEGSEAPRRFTQGDSDSSPKWSPNGKSIAFTRRVDDKPQVFLMPTTGGEAFQATELEDFMTNFKWFNDSQRLLLSLQTSQVESAVEAEKASETLASNQGAPARATPDTVVVKHARYISNGLGYLDSKRQHLYVFDTATKFMQHLTHGEDYNVNSPQISADDKFVVYSANKSGLEYEGDQDSNIFRINIETKEHTKLSSHKHAQYSPALSSDNKAIAYLHNEDNFEQTDLWVMNSNGDDPKNLTEDFDRFVGEAMWGVQNKSLYFLASDEGTVRLFNASIESAQVRPIFTENKTIRNLTLSPTGEFAVFTMEDSTQLPELFRYNLTSDTLTKLTHFNEELLSTVALSPAQELWFKNDKGMDVQGFLHKPIHFVKGKKYPLILNIKGGPGGMWGHQWFHENQMYAAQGYAVAYVNYSGSNGYGIKHSKAVRMDYGGADYEDNIQFLDSVLAQNNWIDNEALFITGGSHGGFLTNWITTKTDRFKAAVTQRSVSSWISEAGTQEFTPMQMNAEFGGSLWQNFDYYWDRSPLQFADKVSTPTLIIHSDADMITPIGQGQEWFYALKSNNVPTEMVIFTSENHSLSRSGKPTNLVARLEYILEWFERYSN